MSAVLLEEFGAADPRAESWRYSRTALRALAQNDFAAAATDARPDADLLARVDWPATRGRRLVFVNGAYAADLSEISALAGGTVESTGQQTALTLSQNGALAHMVYIGVPGAGATRWDVGAQVRIAARDVTLIEQHVAGIGADLLGSAQITVDVADEA